MPKRIRMTRQKGGWRRDHPEAVVVARPTRWGNPWRIGVSLCEGRGQDYTETRIETNAQAVLAFRQTLQEYPRNYPAESEIIAHLRGKDLACWCALDQPCHADVLIEIANK